jgi:hypothetical protein
MTTDTQNETAAEDSIVCAHCDAATDTDSALTVQVGRRGIEQTWCDACAADHATPCGSCEELTDCDSMQELRTALRRREAWCMPCFNNGETVYCGDTGEHSTYAYACDHLYYWESDDAWHDSAEEDDQDTLADYSTDVLEVHGWPRETSRHALCFGVELEMETTTDRETVVRMLGGKHGDGRYILKSDGSLNYDSGIELVTLPYTLDQHAQSFNWPALLQPLARRARSGAGTNRCGIHIHANRRALSPLQIGKTLVFLNCNGNHALVRAIAQRPLLTEGESGGSNYCVRDTRKRIKDGGMLGASRYDLLNISGRQTIEFRLFRGNLRPERVLKNLEFCHAILTYCATASMRDVEQPQPFLDWLAARSKTYAHLTCFLRAAGFMPARAPAPAQFAAAAAVSDL